MAKTKKIKKEKLSGSAGFEIYYRTMFGERWSKLKAALLEPVSHMSLRERLRAPYFLDKASYWATSVLPQIEGGSCLDMCAAPGGKSLVLMTKVLSNTTLLQANEFSRSRRARMQKVLSECLDEAQQARIKISGFDGSIMCKHERAAYERILLDAPCSSERHVLGSEKYLAQWTEARIKNLAMRQWSLLSSAFLLLKAGGFLLYSTCALSEAENDCVIDKLLAKYSEAEIVSLAPFENAETTRYGLIFLPDTSGAGPLYAALIGKKCSSS